MRKISILLVAASLALVSCSSGGSKAPRNLDNACSIKKQKKSWFKDLNRVERKWGVPKSIILATVYQESKFDADARTPYRWSLGVIPMGRASSAYGYSQALDGTWDWYKKDTGRRGAKRNDFGDSVDFIGWYFNQTLEKNGVSKSNAYAQYLNYHDGHAGYRRGTYRSKAWLIDVARSVETRSILYQNQLNRCS